MLDTVEGSNTLLATAHTGSSEIKSAATNFTNATSIFGALRSKLEVSICKVKGLIDDVNQNGEEFSWAANIGGLCRWVETTLSVNRGDFPEITVA